MNDTVLPDLITEVPAAVTTALDGILNDTYGNEVRTDIVTALQWRLDYIGQVTRFINDLGLIVKNGQLCVIYNET